MNLENLSGFGILPELLIDDFDLDCISSQATLKSAEAHARDGTDWAYSGTNASAHLLCCRCNRNAASALSDTEGDEGHILDRE